MTNPTKTEDTLRRFFADEVGEVDLPDSLPAALAQRAGQRAQARRRAGVAAVGIAAAAAIVLGLGLLRDSGPTSRVEVSPAESSTTLPEAGAMPIVKPTTTSTTEPPQPSTRPAVAVQARANGTVVVLDAKTGKVLRTLYRAPDPSRQSISDVVLTADRQTVHFEVYDSGGDNCAPKHYSVPVAGGTPTAVADMGLTPVFSPDGKHVAFTVDSSKHGGPHGPGFHCRQAIMVRNLATGAERVWTERRTDDPSAPSVSELAWSADSTRLLFERTYNDAHPDRNDYVIEVRSLDITRTGEIAAASEVLVAGSAGALEGMNQGEGRYLPTSPVGLEDGGIAYVRLDGNSQFGAIVVRDAAGRETVLVEQSKKEITGIGVDVAGGHVLAFYSDGVRSVDVRSGRVEGVTTAPGTTAW